jgi:hypothetical protein
MAFHCRHCLKIQSSPKTDNELLQGTDNYPTREYEYPPFFIVWLK